MNFEYIMLSFLFNSKKSLISFLISILTHSLFSSELFSFYVVCILLFLLLLASSFNLGQTDRMQGIILIFLYLLRLDLSEYVVSFGKSSMKCYKEGIW